MHSAPVLPALDGVRLATPDDLARIATVAAAGFFHSPTFHYQRVHHAAYPHDTILSYWTEYCRAMTDPASIVLVTEDVIKDTERDDVYPALKEAAAYSPGTGSLGSKMVVGVASVTIKPGSSYIGQFQPEYEGLPDPSAIRTVSVNSNRDVCADRMRTYNETTAPAKERYLAGQMRLSTLAVHPTYWRRGHATRLVGWCTRLADLDGVSMGVSAVPQGAIIAARAGFEEREIVRVERPCMSADEPKAVGAELWVAVRRPSGSPVSGDSASSLESQ